MSMHKSLWIVGAGKMGQALYQGWAKAGVPIAAVTLIDPSAKPDDVILRPGDTWTADMPHAMKSPDCVLFAVKPQIMAETVAAYRTHLTADTLVLSIAAGVSMMSIATWLHQSRQPIIRLMPNTPALIGAGMTVGVANAHVTALQRRLTAELFAAVGVCAWLDDEDQMHAVTALSGSGPAYVFALIEAMTAAGVAVGLDPALAATLARQTVAGSGALAAAQPDVDAAQLRRNVTSPNGTTAAGLTVLQASQNGLDDLIEHTVTAAWRRSHELGS